MFSKSALAQQRREKLLQYVLDRNDAEFLLEKVSDGKFKIRIGQIWKVPEVPRGETILLLDLDNCRKRPKRGNIRKRLNKCGVSALRILIRRSPSRTGYHGCIIVAGKYDKFQRIALQAICESDYEREAQNFRRAQLARPEGGDNWNVLYKK